MDMVVIRGGGDLATGIGYRLYKAGFSIVILDIEKPLSIRRTVSFCEAIYDGEITIEDVNAVLCKDVDAARNELDNGNIPVLIDPLGESISSLKPLAVVDSIIAKRNLGTNRNMAPITIGVGPGFEAGVDVDLVVESLRGHDLGKVIYSGKAVANSGIPADVLGFKQERIIRAVANGTVRWNYKIGELVDKGDTLGTINSMEIKAEITGIVRGLIREGLFVEQDMKIGDLDPRGRSVNPNTISDKARAIGGGVLEAIMYLKAKPEIVKIKR